MRRYSRGILKPITSSRPPWRTPDHPPYSQMVEIALRGLSEEGGSTESSISAFIQSTFTDLPWGHDRLLPYYLGKLVVSGEVYSPSLDRYQLRECRPQLLPSAHSVIRRRGRTFYRTNPTFYPTFYPLHSTPPRSRGRSGLLSSRGKSSKDSAEGTPLQHDQVSARKRGRPRHRPEGAVDVAGTQRLVHKTRRSRGSRIRKDVSRVRKLSNKGDGESAASDIPKNFELTPSQSSPERILPLLLTEQLSAVNCPPFSASELPEFPEKCEGRASHNTGKIVEFSNDKTTVGSETCALDDIEQPEYCGGRELPLVTSKPVEVSSCLALELSEDGKGKSPQGEEPSSLVLDPPKLVQEQTSPGDGLPLLSPEKPENADHGPEKSVDSQEKVSPGKRTALVALEQEVLEPLPLQDGDEIERGGMSSKQKKARRNRRRLRLWFEG